MFIRQLAYLTALAREHHFARAAMSCNVSQPTLSAGIRGLEDELGVPIVMRGHRFMGLTPEGERVLAWSQRILSDLDGLKQDLAELKDGLVGRLRLGVVPAALPVVAPLTASLIERHPHLALDVASMSSASIQLGLDGFEIDFGITYLDNEPLKGVRSLALYQERYVFVTPPGGPFADREQLTWAEAATASLCLLGPSMQNRRIIDGALKEAGSDVRARVEADSFVTLAGYLRAGSRASIFPDSYISFVGESTGARFIPLIEPERIQTIGIVYPDREPVPPTIRAVIIQARTFAIEHPANRFG